MTNEPIIEQLGGLVDTFERDAQLAKEINSPNAEDDLAIKIEMVGFSYNSRTDEWDLGHFEFVKKRIAREFPENELVDYAVNAENVKLFFALSIGYLLGLYHQTEIGDDDFRLAELLLSGLIMQHLGKLTNRPVP